MNISTTSWGKSKMVLLGSVLFLSSFFFGGQTSAATILWDGGGDGTTFSQGLNWAGDVTPGASDLAMITGAGNIVIDASTTLSNLGFNGGYSGTTTMASGVVVTTSAEFFMSNGTFVVGTNNTLNVGANLGVGAGLFQVTGGVVNVSGNTSVTSTLLMSGGALNLAGNLSVVTGGVFSGTAGTVTMSGSSISVGGSGNTTFYNLNLTGSGTATFGGSVTTTNFTVNGSGLTVTPNVNLVISGDFTNTAGIFNQTTGTTTFTGVGNLSGRNASIFKNLIFATGTTTAQSHFTASTITINSNAVLINTSTVMFISGSDTPFVINGTFTVASSSASSVYYSGSSYNIATTTYYNLFANGTTASLAGDITVYNGFYGSAAITQSTGTVNMSSVYDTYLGDSGTFSLYNLTVATTTLQSNVTVSKVLTLNNSLSLGSYTLTLSATGTPFVNNGGVSALNGETGTVTYSGSEVNVTGGLTFTNLTINSASSTLLGNVTTTQQLTIGSSKKLTATGRSVTVETLSNSGTFVQSGSGTLTFNGNAAGGTGGSNGNFTFYDLVVNGTGVSIFNDVTTTHTFTINASKDVNLTTSNIRLTGTGTPLVVNGTLTASSSNIMYSGATANIATTTFATLTLSADGEYTLSGNATSTVATVNNGTLNIGDYDLIISSGDYTNNATTTETGVGRVKKAATGGLSATSYTSGSANGTGNTISISVTDPTANLLAASAETKTVTLAATTYSDSETITLTETGVATGIFSGSIPFNITSAAASNSKMDVSANGNLTLTYSNGYGTLSGSGTSATYTGSTYSSGGAGGGAPSVPTVSSPTAAVSVSVVSSDSQTVTLSLSATNATQVAISEDLNFANASWEAYVATKQFKLSAGNGQKTIYVKFRSSAGGETAVYKVVLNSNGNPIPASVVDKTPAPVVAAPQSVVSPFAVANADSKVVISPVKKLEYKPNSSVAYTYSFKNETNKTLKVKVLRQVVDGSDKVVAKVSGAATIAKGKTFKSNTSNLLSSKLPDGTYTIQVVIMDSKNNILDKNSFDVTVKRPLPPPSITTNNPESKVVITGLKVDYKPGNAVKYTYSYKNESGKPVKVNIVRQVVDGNGKVVAQVDGARTLSKDQSFKFNATSSLSKKLTAGAYTVKVKVLDSKKVVLDENSFDFNVVK